MCSNISTDINTDIDCVTFLEEQRVGASVKVTSLALDVSLCIHQRGVQSEGGAVDWDSIV